VSKHLGKLTLAAGIVLVLALLVTFLVGPGSALGKKRAYGGGLCSKTLWTVSNHSGAFPLVSETQPVPGH
jgi:hypothetical protein